MLSLIVEFFRLAFDVLANVGQKSVNVDWSSLERDFATVAESQIQRCSLASGLYRAAFDLQPIIDDLVDAKLDVLLVVPWTGEFKKILKQFGRLRILVAIHSLVNQHLQSLAMLTSATSNHGFDDRDMIEFIREIEPFDSSRQLCDRFRIGQFMSRPLAGILWLLPVCCLVAANLNHGRPAN